MRKEIDNGTIGGWTLLDGTENRRYNGKIVLCHWYRAAEPSFYDTSGGKMLIAYEYAGLAAGHDYELSFISGLNYNASFTVTVWLGTNTVFKHEFKAFTDPDGSNLSKINVRFTAPDSIVNTEKIMIEISVPKQYQYGSNGESAKFLISEEIIVSDLTENPTWLYKILKKFDEIGDWFDSLGRSISSGFTNLGNKIGGFFESMQNAVGDWFADQLQKIQDFSDSVGNWFEDLKLKIETAFQETVDEIKSWFIPHEGYFDEYKAEWEAWASEHFGVLVQVPDLLIELFHRLGGLMSYNSYSFTFPEISVPIGGKNYVFVNEQIVDMSYWLNGQSTTRYLYDVYTLCVFAVFAFALIKYTDKVYDHMFRVGG